VQVFAMKVASYNIHKCRGTDGRTQPERILGVIKELEADLIALQEVDKRFGRKDGLLNPEAIRQETGMRLLVQSDLPQGHGWHGNALLVRAEPRFYHRRRLRLPGFEPRGAIVAELNLGEGDFRVIAAHLGLLRRSRLDQASALLKAHREMSPMPTILMGDFNEWRVRQRSSLSILEPIFGSGASPRSFPSRRPIFALDRILGWPDSFVSNLAVHASPLARIASDHLPLTAHAQVVGNYPPPIP
jgi:endonuclease/exonuclease/phosphatase family metal-dependent hydrolase